MKYTFTTNDQTRQSTLDNEKVEVGDATWHKVLTKFDL